MTNTDFHARRTELSNTFAAAGAQLLDYMGCAGALAAIPNTQQYVVAGDIAAIRAQLDTVAPQRRMRHGERPELDLYFGPETGQPRRWAALITSAGHGMLQEYGTKFEYAQPGQEVLEVMEILPGAANKAAEEGELPPLPTKEYEFTSPKTGWFTASQMEGYARQAIAADRASRQVANKEEVDDVPEFTVQDADFNELLNLVADWKVKPQNMDTGLYLVDLVEKLEGRLITSLKSEKPDGFVAIAVIGSEYTSVAFRDEDTARACCVKGEVFPFWKSPVATPPATTGASTAPAGFALHSRVADLLHLLEFAEISTPSKGDAEQAKKAMRDVRRMLNEDPFGTREVAAQAGQVAVPDEEQIEWSHDIQKRLIEAVQDEGDDEGDRQVMAEAACLLAALTGRAPSPAKESK